jgi:Phage protein Gp138 N-terminal domain
LTIQLKTIVEPTTSDMLDVLKQDIFASLNCVRVGQIQSFDSSKQTATVALLGKRVYPDGTIADYGPLLDVPIIVLQGGGGYIQLPATSGDMCLVLFNDRNIDNWYSTGSAQAPATGRMHSLSDGFALVGVNALTNLLSPIVAGTIKIVMGSSEIDLSNAELKAKNGAAEIDLTGGLITLKNATTALLTLLQNLATVLEAATVQGPSTTYPLTSATIAAITNWASTLTGLLGS